VARRRFWHGVLVSSLQKVFETIVSAKLTVAGVGPKEPFLDEKTIVVESQGSPIGIAKEAALGLVHSGYSNGKLRMDIPVVGSKGVRAFQTQIDKMCDVIAITEHDAVIALQVATILCGGDQPAGVASEQHFLDLEREAFLSLLATKKTQERIAFLLKNNKPLRN